MTFIGRVSNGTILLPPEAHLSEGEAVEIRPISATHRAKTGRELAAIWADSPRLPADEAANFARDVEAGHTKLNRPPTTRNWE